MLTSDHIAIQCPQCGHTEFEELPNNEGNDYVICCNCKSEISNSDLEDEGMEQAKRVIVSQAKESVVKLFKLISNSN